MIFSNMEYPGKNYRVQVYDAWLGEELEPMDNPEDGDKIVYRVIGENGQPVEQKTEVYQNGEWVEQGGGGGGSDYPMFSVTATSSGGFPPSFVFSDAACDTSYADLVAALNPGDSSPALITVTLSNGRVTEAGGNVFNSAGTTLIASFYGTAAGTITMEYTAGGINVQ